MCLDGEKNDRVAFQARADYQNHAIDGCIGDTVPLAVGKWYDFHEFGWYMGNVGLIKFDNEVGSDGRALISSLIAVRNTDEAE